MLIIDQTKYTKVVFESYEEYCDFKHPVSQDLLEIKVASTDIEISEYPKGIVSEYLICWKKPVLENFQSYFSVSTGKKILKSIRNARNNGVSYQIFDHAPEELYKSWYEKIYLPFVVTHQITAIIGPDWLKEHNFSHSGIFIFKDNQVIGARYFKKLQKRNAISFSYKAIARLEGIDLNPLAEYAAFEVAKHLAVDEIRIGVDENLYGARLNVGLAEYKEKYGYSPCKYEHASNYLRYICPLNLRVFDENLLTYVYDDSSKTYIRHYFSK